MGKNRVGDAMLQALEQAGYYSVCTYDGIMATVGRELDLPLWKGMNPHPLNYARLAASYLRRDDRFVSGTINAGRRLSCFWIKGHEPDQLRCRKPSDPEPQP